MKVFLGAFLPILSLFLAHCDAAGISLQNIAANGSFHGRSGNAVIIPSSQASLDASTFFVDHSAKLFKSTDSISTIQSVNAADLHTRALGVQPTKLGFAPEYLSSNLMKASLIINVPSSSMPLDIASSVSAGLNHPSFPASPLSLLNTIATGSMPSQHGITGESWPNGSNGTHSAFTEGNEPMISNIADNLLKEFPQALVFSASADSKYADSFSPRFASGPNVVTSSMHPSGSFVATGSNSVVAQEHSKTDLLTSAGLTPLNILVDETTAYYGKVTFDLASPVHKAFLSELAYFEKVSRINSVSKTHEALTDSSPDLLVFSYSALKELLATEEASSPRALAAKSLVKTQCETIMKRFSDVYSNRLLSSVNFLGTPSTVDGSVVSNVSDIIKKSLGEDISVNTESFPLVFVSPAGPAAGMLGLPAPIDVCAETGLVSSLTEAGFTTYCPESSSMSPLAMELTADDDPVPPPAPVVITTNEIITYQIVLWLSIGFFFVLYHILDFLAFMDFKKDASLFGVINPVWTRSAGHAHSH